MAEPAFQPSSWSVSLSLATVDETLQIGEIEIEPHGAELEPHIVDAHERPRTVPPCGLGRGAAYQLPSGRPLHNVGCTTLLAPPLKFNVLKRDGSQHRTWQCKWIRRCSL
eukprot:6179452-Pleurochrysis_carterae.AAC.4